MTSGARGCRARLEAGLTCGLQGDRMPVLRRVAMMTAAVTKKRAMTRNKAVYDLHRQEAREEYEVPNAETIQAMEDVRLGRNLVGPFDTVEELFESLDLDADD